jgi:hypothetical protein
MRARSWWSVGRPEALFISARYTATATSHAAYSLPPGTAANDGMLALPYFGLSNTAQFRPLAALAFQEMHTVRRRRHDAAKRSFRFKSASVLFACTHTKPTPIQPRIRFILCCFPFGGTESQPVRATMPHRCPSATVCSENTDLLHPSSAHPNSSHPSCF